MSTKNTKPKTKETVKKGTKAKAVSTQRYLEFSEVHDNTLILKDGGVRAVLEVSSVNFNLKSEKEQNSIILAYQRFLNALNFPTQILVRSRKLDIDHYLMSLRKKLASIENPLLQRQMEEYIEYIGKLVEFADIMEKKFFVVVPQNPPEAEQVSFFKSFLKKIRPDDSVLAAIKRKKEYKDLRRELENKIDVVTTGLQNCGLTTRLLTTEEIIRLFYQMYNPNVARHQKLDHMEDHGGVEVPSENLIPEDEQVDTDKRGL